VENGNKIPVAEGIFTINEKGVSLIGTRCISCGNHYFPQAISCKNPRCNEKRVEKVLLSKRGKLYSYTIQYYLPPPPFRMESKGPYAIGLIELPEGIRVMGMLTGLDFEEIKIGMEMELTLERLYVDEKGNEVVTYKFRPSR
jgi:uncharacterized OB-fold protein